MPSTFVHGLLPSACFLALNREYPKLTHRDWIRIFFISAILSNLPDLDIIPASCFPTHWQEIHRAWGHNCFALLFWIFIGTKIIVRWGSPLFESRKWLISGSLVLSHVFLDSMQDYDHFGVIRGVPLFWPFSSAEYALPFRLFKVLQLKYELHFLLAHVTSFEFWHTAILYEISNSMLLLAIWTTGYFLATRLKRYGKLLSHFKTIKKTSEKTASPSPHDGQQCSPELPSRPLRDDSLTHINTGS